MGSNMKEREWVDSRQLYDKICNGRGKLTARNYVTRFAAASGGIVKEQENTSSP